MNYLVSDFVIRLKNACMARRREVILPYSKLNAAIGQVLTKAHYLTDIKEDVEEGKKILKGTINFKNRVAVMHDVAIISKPSLRVYARSKGKARKRHGMGIAVISTSSGVMTEKEALKKGIGGELLFEIW